MWLRSLASLDKHTGPQSANDIRDLSRYFKFVKTLGAETCQNTELYKVRSAGDRRASEMFVETLG